jgi:hypothetical protein
MNEQYVLKDLRRTTRFLCPRVLFLCSSVEGVWVWVWVEWLWYKRSHPPTLSRYLCQLLYTNCPIGYFLHLSCSFTYLNDFGHFWKWSVVASTSLYILNGTTKTPVLISLENYMLQIIFCCLLLSLYCFNSCLLFPHRWKSNHFMLRYGFVYSSSCECVFFT